jgi:nitrogen fixation protein FixH
MTQSFKKKDKLIPWYFVIFFVVLAILDGIFVSIATLTHRGLVTEHSYQKGLNYNNIIAASDNQEKLGWDGKINFFQPSIHFSLFDENNLPIAEAQVDVYIDRVLEKNYSFQTSLKYIKNGVYAQDIIFPLKGQWEILVIVEWQQQYYQKKKRVVVQ